MDILDYIDDIDIEPNLDNEIKWDADDPERKRKEMASLVQHPVDWEKTVDVRETKHPDRLTKEYIISCLQEHNKEDLERKRSYKKKSLALSQINECIRKNYFVLSNQYIEEPSYQYPYLEIVCSIGDSVHDILQKRIPHEKIEGKVKMDYNGIFLSGRFDMHYKDNVLIEFKTDAIPPNKPKKKYIAQTVVYAYLLNEFKGYNIELAQIVYYSRGKGNIKIFDIEITDDLMDTVHAYLNELTTTLKYHLDAGFPPPLSNSYINQESCFFCEYKKACESNSGKFKQVEED